MRSNAYCGNKLLKTVIIHGQNHKGATYHIAHQLADKIGGELTEFFLPRDFGEFCIGCGNCFTSGEETCPHYSKLHSITEAIDDSDVIILASPVYVFHATGAMKAFLDHYGYRWMVHRPSPGMFTKQGVCISTAAGAGMRLANKDMADSLFFWGIAKIYRYGIGVAAISWDTVSPRKKAGIYHKTTELANVIRRRNGNVHPGLRTRLWFSLMRHIKGISDLDRWYWEINGWTGKRRPWN